MSWLDDERGKVLSLNGTNLPDRKNLAITAPGATASDSEANKRTTIDFTGLTVPQYDAMADLRAIDPVDGRITQTRGYTSPLDGGDGTWQGTTGNAPGTYTHNGGTVIVPAGGDGSAAWVRMYPGAVYPEWFGATRDGTTDDSVALQAAIDEAQRVNSSVCLQGGTYSHASSLVMGPGAVLTGQGPGSILHMVGTNLNSINATTGSAIRIRDITIRGNQTGVGSTIEANGGHGVFVHTVTDIKITSVNFENIGLPSGATSAGCIAGNDIDGIEVDGCYFDDSNRSDTGADVSLGYRARNVIVTNCHSYSDHDIFVGLTSTVSTVDQLSKYVVANNVAVRTSENARHGVVVVYGAVPAACSITGNVFEGFPWTAVYVTAPDPLTFAGEDSAGVAISGNTIRFCGGAGAISDCIHVSGTAGATVSGNLIYGAGYDSTLTARTAGAYNPGGIKCNETSHSVSISGNTISKSAYNGINVEQNNDGDSKDINITGNTVTECQHHGISVTNTNSDIDRCIISSNIVTVSNGGDAGCYLFYTAGSISGLKVTDNTFTSLTGGGVQSGIFIQATTFITGEVTGNRFEGFVEGFRQNTHVSGTGQHDIPDLLYVARNKFSSCTTGARGYEKAVFIDSIFDNCTTNLHSTSAWDGAHIGHNASGEIIVEVRGTAAPTTRAWRVGDRVINVTPAASGNAGWVCVTAGTPGTWKTFGTISA